MKSILKTVESRSLDLFKKKLLRISIGIVFLWFGLLKFSMQNSSVKQLAIQTLNYLTFGLLEPEVLIYLLAGLESFIGILLIFNLYIRVTIILALIHIGFTFLPLLLFPEISFIKTSFSFTLVGQYIAKNIIILFALFTIYPPKN